ncbi:Hypothetical protein R9X50_00359300 [Acrodontium crateriforme]|uniref:Carboxylic ester hydrolase n=1 Tax=Acrodontium crateriforme TaxID=150365 RepID=A0AAQ3RBZ6_9PEZI|nr:Hypothetical protein R9X50_00359300 [Acrodontium crateriforme]
MRLIKLIGTQAVLASLANGLSLQNNCNKAYAKSVLPSDDVYPGITIDTSSVTASAFYKTSVSGDVMFPDAVFDYCNITFAYSHNGRDDQVLVTYWLPAPSKFKKRFLSTGGGGLAINSGQGSLPGGIIYGAAAGLTDGGFGGFSNTFDTNFLLANDTINWQQVYMFGYQAIHEMTVLGKALTKNFFGMTAKEKLYSYYQGCSEGGREGWSQAQRYTEFDGVIAGAPAFRYAHQQVNHLYSNIVEQTLGYYPPPCELSTIANETIKACDPLDGKTDGVVSRTDLCKLHFDINTLVGTTYNCAAVKASTGGMGPPSSAQPAQKGTISANGVKVAAKILDGLRDLDGRRAYFSYQPAATFDDAQTKYDSTSGKWILNPSSLGGEWVERFLLLQNASTLPTLDGVTYDTLTGWIELGLQLYYDNLQTTNPDLTTFQAAGGKILHYHGESDSSIPTASSVRYRESVREIMYPGMSDDAANAALNKWYQLYLVPGAGHCGPNTLQPNGPFPQTNLAVMIDWVENGNTPTTLNATVLLGSNKGKNGQICAWPSRPLWNKSGKMECVSDEASIKTWQYDLDAFKLPIY